MKLVSNQKILIVAPAWLGDMVMAHSLIQVLKAQHPNAYFALLAPKSTLAITELMPEINERFVLEDGHKEFSLKRRWQLARTMRKQHFDIAYVLPNTLKSAFIPFFARIKKRIGWKGESRYILLNDLRNNVKQYPLMAERYVALGYPAGQFKPGNNFPYPKLVVPETLKQQVIEKFSLKKEKTLVISPSAAYGPAKRWPPEYFAEVAKAKIDEGWQVWMIGAPSDQELADTILSIEPRVQNFVGKTSLLEMAALISLSNIALTNDSGPMHIAAALDIPLIAIFGSSSPGFTPPLQHGVSILEVKNLECKPCFQRTCPFGHYRCLKEVYPAQILNTLSIK